MLLVFLVNGIMVCSYFIILIVGVLMSFMVFVLGIGVVILVLCWNIMGKLFKVMVICLMI